MTARCSSAAAASSLRLRGAAGRRLSIEICSAALRRARSARASCS